MAAMRLTKAKGRARIYLMNRKHMLFVTIETDDPMTVASAAAKLRAWLETYGHTAPSFGFEFIDVSGKIKVDHIID